MRAGCQSADVPEASSLQELMARRGNPGLQGRRDTVTEAETMQGFTHRGRVTAAVQDRGARVRAVQSSCRFGFLTF